MPVTVSYPGVYIEEIPSGVRTIVGVPTSIAAFVGRALRGKENEAVVINGFGDFERIFGGLWRESSLGYAVRDFFLNGGGQAIIVRLFHPTFASTADRDAAVTDAQAAAKAVSDAAAAEAAKPAATPDTVAQAARTAANVFTNENEWKRTASDKVAAAAEAAKQKTGATKDSVAQAAADAQAGSVNAAVPVSHSTLSVNGLNLMAAYPGSWGNALRARVNHDTRAALPGEDPNSLFNLFVRDGLTGQLEEFRNVSVTPGHAREIGNVLKNESRLVQLSGSPPAARPSPHGNTTDPNKGVWDDNTTPTNSNVSGLASDGGPIGEEDFTGPGKEDKSQGLYALSKVDIFNLLCIPPYKAASGIPNQDVDPTLINTAAAFCQKYRAFLIIDPPSNWTDKDAAKKGISSGVGDVTNHAAVFFPRLRQPNPLRDNQIETFAPCGAVAGVFARTDTQRGVWKAPAGLQATLVGVPDLSVKLNDAENGELNPLGINCLRVMPAAGRVVWGARTREGADRLTSEWKYIPVRRTALFIEESLYRGTQWVVFEPNDEPLWAQIRMNVGAFMQSLFRQGAFQGASPREAYLVKCDRETTTQNDINLGIVNIVVGFAPLKPAEFVIIKIQQLAGQIET